MPSNIKYNLLKNTEKPTISKLFQDYHGHLYNNKSGRTSAKLRKNKSPDVTQTDILLRNNKKEMQDTK
jgi:hypothetical protein